MICGESFDVVEDRPAFFDGGDDRAEVVVGQDHARCFLGDVVAAHPHGDADVGLLERRRVVDAVAGDGDDLAHLFQLRDDPQFMLRSDAGENRFPLGKYAAQTSVIHLGDFRAGESLQRCVLAQADLPADAGGGERVVAGDHNDADAGSVAGVDRRCDFGPQRIG